ncbi:MAG: cupin domain-containing protein [Verrucomicrobia bacterium]|nr:cupin domain-containing protein [Verrucomicrobiota bacterium]
MNQGIYSIKRTTPYHFREHTNELVMDRSHAEACEVFVTIIQPGKTTPLHKHDDAEQVYFVLSGIGRIERGQKCRTPQTIRPGEVVHIPRETYHKVSCAGKKTLKYLVVDVFPGGRPEAEPTWHSHVAGVAQWLGGRLRKKGRGFRLCDV